jgi:histidine triad (HIT) family protein
MSHIYNFYELDDPDLYGQLIFTGQIISKDLNIAESGHRLVFNCNDEGGQEIQHIHLHLLGGRSMQWPPG